MFFADGALLGLSRQSLKLLNLSLGFFDLWNKLFGFALSFERLNLILTNTLLSLHGIMLDFTNGHFLDGLLLWCFMWIDDGLGVSLRLSLLLQQFLLLLLQFLNVVHLFGQFNFDNVRCINISLKQPEIILFFIDQLLALLDVGLQLRDMFLGIGKYVVEFGLGSGPLILLLDDFLQLLDMCLMLLKCLLALINV